MRSSSKAPLFVTALAVATVARALASPSDPAATPEFFETKVRPVLANNCYACHTTSAMGGLRLDSRDAMLKGGGRGAALVPGDPDKSLLITAVRQTDENLKMPQGGKLKGAEVEDLVAWVKAGAVWPAGSAPVTAAASPSGAYVIPRERKKFWSLLPIQDVQLPQVKDTKWAKTTIDRLVLAKLEENGLKPVHPANKQIGRAHV